GDGRFGAVVVADGDADAPGAVEPAPEDVVRAAALLDPGHAGRFPAGIVAALGGADPEGEARGSVQHRREVRHLHVVVDAVERAVAAGAGAAGDGGRGAGRGGAARGGAVPAVAARVLDLARRAGPAHLVHGVQSDRRRRGGRRGAVIEALGARGRRAGGDLRVVVDVEEAAETRAPAPLQHDLGVAAVLVELESYRVRPLRQRHVAAGIGRGRMVGPVVDDEDVVDPEPHAVVRDRAEAISPRRLDRKRAFPAPGELIGPDRGDTGRAAAPV